jgi:hypothetical protein
MQQYVWTLPVLMISIVPDGRVASCIRCAIRSLLPIEALQFDVKAICERPVFAPFQTLNRVCRTSAMGREPPVREIAYKG